MAASNFFRLKRYLSLSDSDMVSRAASLRVWYMVQRWSMMIFVAVAVAIAFLGLEASDSIR